MRMSGWGRYPYVDATVVTPTDRAQLLNSVSSTSETMGIAFGLRRSYGDSALAERMISTRYLDRFISFDPVRGELTCEAGVCVADILRIFVPRGWFLPVTPGTKHVTVGGAVASDVHGKNHHLAGAFSSHVRSLSLVTPGNGILRCSRNENAEVFRATCGGMGLTGIILEVTFRLIRIQSSYLDQVTIKTHSLEETIEVLDEGNSATYSVAWIDCVSGGRALGRSLVMLGEHSSDGNFHAAKSSRLVVPFNVPGVFFNKYSIRVFNELYYHKVMRRRFEARVHYEAFFYPLDGIARWNRLYGRSGFVQYQFVLPRSSGLDGLKEIFSRIVASKRGSFLAVLKVFGDANENMLSFPISGYTLALDFKVEAGLFKFLDELDEIVLAHGGRLYLTKDARMSERTFKSSYPEWETFAAMREILGVQKAFASRQSKRLGV